MSAVCRHCVGYGDRLIPVTSPHDDARNPPGASYHKQWRCRCLHQPTYERLILQMISRNSNWRSFRLCPSLSMHYANIGFTRPLIPYYQSSAYRIRIIDRKAERARNLVRGEFAARCGWTFLLTFFKFLHKDRRTAYTVVQKNAPTLADYNYDPVQSMLIIFSKLFDNDHKSCLVVKFFISPHICCHYTLWNTMLYFARITLLIAKNTCFLRVALKRTG